MVEPIAVQVRDDSIRLGQFLKLAGVVDQGSDVRVLLARGDVTVNNTPEVRRGRQLRAGDVVALGPNSYVVRGPA